jgi:hypothetical protein
MAGYIGTKASVVSSGAERKKVFDITTTTTSLTGCSYTPNQVHVFHNGVRLVDGTDYTATDGSTVTLTTAAQNGDEVVVISYATFQTSDTVSASAGGTFSGDITISGSLSVDGGTIKLDGNYPVGSNNVALGDTALDSNVSGADNVAVGSGALTALTTGNNNHAFGQGALQSNVSGGQNVAIGRLALQANTASNNTAVGHNAGYNNTSGASNTAIGYASLVSNTTASNNTAVGHQAGYSNTAANNTFLGFAVGYANTTGTENVGVGGEGASSNTTLRFNTSGSYNTAIGISALSANTTANRATAVGYQAGYSKTSGTNFTAVGYQAGYSNTTGGENSFFGGAAGGQNTTGYRNTFLGYSCGSEITTGNKNTIIGAYNGNQNGLDIRTLTNRIVLSDGDGNIGLYVDSAGSVLVGGTSKATFPSQPVVFQAGGSGTVFTIERNDSSDVLEVNTFANTSTARTHYAFRNSNGAVGTIQTSGSSTSFNTSSDHRLKENVTPLAGATDRLKQLNPSRFNFIVDADTTVDGFLAHEVQSVVPEAITGTKDAVDAEGNPVYQGIDQSKLVPLLVATIQELEARITALEAN